MKKTVLKAVKEFSLLGDYNNPTITVALSGGADSMALLNVLLELKEQLGISVEAAHFNHLIRGEEAERDEAFVKTECERLGVKLYIGRGNVPEYAKEKGISIETAAREMRYDYLNRINKDFIATAHTASDNLETVIFNLARGTAIDGLCGIPPKREIFIRPLIMATRNQVEEYCEENNISYVTDSTNLSDDYTRNKIRHKIVPVLREINPALEKTVTRMSVSLRQDSIALEKSAEEFLKNNVTDNGYLGLKNFSNLDSAIAARAVKMYIETVAKGVKLESVHIKAVLGVITSGGKISLPDKNTVLCENDVLRVLKPCESEKNFEYKVEMTETNDNFLILQQNVNNLLLKNALDCDKIVGQYVIRTRQPGDSIRLKNRGCTKTLTKLYNESDIPKSERDIIPVIADEKGVIWIYGIGVAHRCAVSENSKRIVMINTDKI